MTNAEAANHWRAIEEEKLRKRIMELEKCGEHRQDIIEILEKRVEELEKVAEAAEATYKIYFWDGTKPLNHWEREYNALRAAGYLGGGE